MHNGPEEFTAVIRVGLSGLSSSYSSHTGQAWLLHHVAYLPRMISAAHIHDTVQNTLGERYRRGQVALARNGIGIIISFKKTFYPAWMFIGLLAMPAVIREWRAIQTE